MSLAHTSPDVLTAPIERFVTYPFTSDTEYQQGLSGIIDDGVLEGKSEEEKDEILLRSEVFYFNRTTGSSINLDEARAARIAFHSKFHGFDSNVKPTLPPEDVGKGEEEEVPPTLTFAQLKELIEQGRTDEIPNNKVIPNVLSSEPPSESRSTVRKKPWEVDAAV